MPVGFKWFVPGLLDGSVAFGGEESAGASFLRKDGSVWTTDKDGLILCLLAAEITAVTGQTPSELYAELTARHGAPAYARIDAPATRERKAKLARLAPEQIPATRRYLTDARRLLESSDSAAAFYAAMLASHPDRLNPGALWGAAITLFPAG